MLLTDIGYVCVLFLKKGRQGGFKKCACEGSEDRTQ
ncbi:hypothetical protein SDC9_160969 [bioreactor metagenome]|uniref:Uncharacterized protein n=1 Tax=bioreactor metagenome TaxID=1076179 RepID=A0A645FJ31_9ZZZZ